LINPNTEYVLFIIRPFRVVEEFWITLTAQDHEKEEDGICMS